jgi:hypothetical protein
MLRRCENKCGTEPAYAKVKLKMTLDEWLEWAVPEYTNFNKKYPNLSPNVSRKGDKGHYEIGNIDIVPVKVNQDNRKMIGQAIDGIKRCSTCKKKKKISEFTKKRSCRDGLDNHCKKCKSIRMKEYQSRPEIKAHRKETRKKK